MTACSAEQTATTYPEKIIKALYVPCTSQKRVITLSSVVSGGAAHFGGWIFPTANNVFLWPVYLFLSVVASYIAIAIAIIAVGTIIHFYRAQLLAWPKDVICGEDISDILDSMACLFVPVTIAIAAVASLLLEAIFRYSA